VPCQAGSAPGLRLLPFIHVCVPLGSLVLGSGGVPIPGGVQKPCRYGTLGYGLAGVVGVQKLCRCGTSGHGLAGMVGFGWRLDLMTLEVFSNLHDFMILLPSFGKY